MSDYLEGGPISKKTFEVEIVEINTKVIEIEANSPQEARQIITDKYINGKIDMSEVHEDYEINVL